MVLSFHELAERELNDAAQYYDREQSGLGAKFVADVQRCTDAILEHPEAGPVIRGRVRRRLCRRFRYGVLYTIQPDTAGSGRHESATPPGVLGEPFMNRRPNTRCTRRPPCEL